MTSPHLVSVNLGERSYQILVGQDLLSQTPRYLGEWLVNRNLPVPSLVLIISDPHVKRHADLVAQALTDVGYRTETHWIPSGESAKFQATVETCYNRLIELKADRSTVIFAVGGGVVGDLAGFVAATYVRGIPFVQVPTTLLADVDSSVGGKTGINHPLAKNMIGAFHQPLGVLIDSATLETLPDREFLSGLAEVVKYGVIADAEFFAELENHAEALRQREPAILAKIIAVSCQRKADVVEQDEFERTGLRAILNYGHTFAHAFEALSGYGELLHGEAVAIGMACAARLAQKLGLIDDELVARQDRLLSALHLATTWPQGREVPHAEVIDRMRLDKKSVGGQLRFILPTRLGHVQTYRNIPETVVEEVLQDLRQRSGA